ncbi:hypothetical protein PYCC9005_002947 [Savitreella phatthalungensis]
MFGFGKNAAKRKDKDAGAAISPSIVAPELSIYDDGRDKYWGLENFGSTCYANSVIQALYWTPPFRNALVAAPFQDEVRADMRDKALHIDGTPQPKLATIVSESYAQRSTSGPVIMPAAQVAGKKKKGLSWTTDEEERDELRRRAFYPKGEPPTPHPMFPESPVNKNDQAFRGQEMKPTDDTATDLYKKKLLEEHLVVSPTKREQQDEALLMHSLRDVYLSLISQRKRVGIISPKAFMDTLRHVNEMFRQNIHHDAHEFLNYMLNSVHDGYAYLTSKDSLRDVTFVHDIFEGTLASEVRCLTCENVTSRDESFLDLSLDIEENTSVSACMRAFSASEFLREKNKFFCERCNGLVEAERRMKIRRLPKVLALHLKRFKFEPELQRHVKLQHVVRYDQTLRIANTTDDAADPDRLYELYAVVVHLGGASYHGHYIACVRTDHLGWLLYDDEHVERIPESVVTRFIGGDDSGTACAYVLFYRTVDVEESLDSRAALSLASDSAHATRLPPQVAATLEAANGYHNTMVQPVTPSMPSTGHGPLAKVIPNSATPLGSGTSSFASTPGGPNAVPGLSPPQAAATRKGLARASTQQGMSVGSSLGVGNGPPKPPPTRRMISAVFSSNKNGGDKKDAPQSSPPEIRHPAGTAGAAQQRSLTEPIEEKPLYSLGVGSSGPAAASGSGDSLGPRRPGAPNRINSETYHGVYTQTQISSTPVEEVDEPLHEITSPSSHQPPSTSRFGGIAAGLRGASFLSGSSSGPTSPNMPTYAPASTLSATSSPPTASQLGSTPNTSGGASLQHSVSGSIKRPGMQEKRSSLARFSSFRSKRGFGFGSKETSPAVEDSTNGSSTATNGNTDDNTSPTPDPEKVKRRTSVFGLGKSTS